MFSLPRGTNGFNQNVPLTSAIWENPRTVERYFYKDNSYLFLGASLSVDALPVIKTLLDQGSQAIEVISASSVISPLERHERIAEIKTAFSKVLSVFSMPIGLNDDRHLITIAGSRSGKGTSAIIPNLCLYAGSVICLDPKGENAMITAERRGKGNEYCKGMKQQVYVLDPFGITKGLPNDMRTSFNPLSLLDPESPSVVEDAALLAETLVISTGEKSAHWDESARNVISGIVLHLITKCHYRNPTLLMLREFLTSGDVEGYRRLEKFLKYRLAKFDDRDDDDEEKQEAARALKRMPRDPFWYLLTRMAMNKTLNGVIRGTANVLIGCGQEERGSILSTARRNTAFLDTNNEEYKKTLSGTEWKTLNPHVFKNYPQGATLYLCLPAQRMGTHGRWLRLVITQLFEKMYTDDKPKNGLPVLFLLEEFYSLGHMSVIEKAVGYAAGFGVKLWAILQDLQQLKTLYPSSWQTFLANAGAVQAFGVSDSETTTYLSKALGDIQSYQQTYGMNYSENNSISRPPTSSRLQSIMSANNMLRAATAIGAALSDDATTSDSKGMNATQNQSIHITPLLRPDEIALEFAREEGNQLLLLKGRLPIWCLRTEYFSSPWFEGRYNSQNPCEIPRTEKLLPFGHFPQGKQEQIMAEFEKTIRNSLRSP